ncbi:MAG: UbiX family flavin prenyltransferase [Bacteroidia bacterium]|nr:UbiX family flavin prenyltransferase [Bacteroidia bacterium]
MKKIVVAITGASGSIYAQRFLHYLTQVSDIEVGVVMSKNAPDVWQHELDEVANLPFPIYDRTDYRAPFASGSARYEHMIIIPCSMGTLGRIAHGFSDDLITRAADVILKERRQLICVVRDTPFNLIHIENMQKLTMAGGMILPAIPSFYSKPKSIEEVVDTVVHRALDQIGVSIKSYRWGESKENANGKQH